MTALTFPRDRFSSDSACASDLGWRAGVWPETMIVDGVLYERGRGNVDRREGELLSVQYVPVASPSSPSLTIFND